MLQRPNQYKYASGCSTTVLKSSPTTAAEHGFLSSFYWPECLQPVHTVVEGRRHLSVSCPKLAAEHHCSWKVKISASQKLSGVLWKKACLFFKLNMFSISIWILNYNITTILLSLLYTEYMYVLKTLKLELLQSHNIQQKRNHMQVGTRYLNLLSSETSISNHRYPLL